MRGCPAGTLKLGCGVFGVLGRVLLAGAMELTGAIGEKALILFRALFASRELFGVMIFK